MPSSTTTDPTPPTTARKPKRRRWGRTLLLLLLVLGIVFAAVSFYKGKQEKPITVAMEPAARRTIIQLVSATGKIQRHLLRTI